MPVLPVVPQPSVHLEGPLLPRGFFLGLGLIYLAALAVDRWAARWRLPGAGPPPPRVARPRPVPGGCAAGDAASGEPGTAHLYAGLSTSLRRIQGLRGADLLAGLIVGTVPARLIDALGRGEQLQHTAADITVLLLLGLLVEPAELFTMIPVGLLLAIVLPPARFPWRDRLILTGCGRCCCAVCCRADRKARRRSERRAMREHPPWPVDGPDVNRETGWMNAA